MMSLRICLLVYVGPALVCIVLGGLAMQEWGKVQELSTGSMDIDGSTPVVSLSLRVFLSNER